MNICAECRYFKKSTFNETKHHECVHPDCRNPVSGYPLLCVDLRKPRAACGPDGGKWELGHVGQTVRRAVAA